MLNDIFSRAVVNRWNIKKSVTKEKESLKSKEVKLFSEFLTVQSVKYFSKSPKTGQIVSRFYFAVYLALEKRKFEDGFTTFNITIGSIIEVYDIHFNHHHHHHHFFFFTFLVAITSLASSCLHLQPLFSRRNINEK